MEEVEHADEGWSLRAGEVRTLRAGEDGNVMLGEESSVDDDGIECGQKVADTTGPRAGRGMEEVEGNGGSPAKIDCVEREAHNELEGHLIEPGMSGLRMEVIHPILTSEPAFPMVICQATRVKGNEVVGPHPWSANLMSSVILHAFYILCAGACAARRGRRQ